MAFDQSIRDGVATAKQLLLQNGLMMAVKHWKVVGRDASGPVHATSAVTVEAVVEDSGEAVVGDDGNERQASQKLTILEPYTVDEFDIFEVNGVQLNVARKRGPLDSTGTPFMLEVWLGTGSWR